MVGLFVLLVLLQSMLGMYRAYNGKASCTSFVSGHTDARSPVRFFSKFIVTKLAKSPKDAASAMNEFTVLSRDSTGSVGLLPKCPLKWTQWLHTHFG